MEFVPHKYQKYCIDRIVNDDKIGLFLDMGLGKTVITLTAINELIFNRFEICRVLIIAPKKVAEATWTDEAAKWEHLKLLKFNLILGTVKQRLNALYSPGNVWVIGRDNVAWLVQQLKGAFNFDMVVIDELSSFKSHSSQRFRALKKVRPLIKKVVGLTGTPAPNGYHDLWSQIYLLDQGERLHRTISAYREHYFAVNLFRHEYSLAKGSASAIDEKIKDICVSMTADDYLELPDLVTDDIPVTLPPKIKKAYDKFERGLIVSIMDEQGEVQEIAVNSAVALTGKLLQYCGGAVYDEGKEALAVHSAKLESLAELLEQLNGQSAIIFYNFKHERDRIASLLASEFKSLTVKYLKDPQDLHDWNAGKIDILLLHPASTAYGLNLQHGGHHIIWYGLTWSLELYQQANKRLHRQGQGLPVIVHRLIVKGCKDEDVIQALSHKDDGQRFLMDKLKAKIEGIKHEQLRKI